MIGGGGNIHWCPPHNTFWRVLKTIDHRKPLHGREGAPVRDNNVRLKIQALCCISEIVYCTKDFDIMVVTNLQRGVGHACVNSCEYLTMLGNARDHFLIMELGPGQCFFSVDG